MKTFYIVEVNPQTPGHFGVPDRFDGTIVDARKSLTDEKYPNGTYRILEDTSGIITKASEVTPKVTVRFDSSRKRGPRQPKPEGGAAEPKKKAKAGK